MNNSRPEKGFPHRIKTLRKACGMTQKDVAGHIGLGQSAIANYEQGLRFPDEQTLKSLSAFFDVSIDFLLGNSPDEDIDRQSLPSVRKRDPGSVSDIYRRLLLEQRFAEAMAILTETLQGGCSLETMYSEILIPVLAYTGTLWERGTIDIAEEHLISEAVERHMAVLSFLNPPLSRLNARCVCTTAGPEMHSIGTRMVSDLLAGAGWGTWFLGIHTPTPDILSLCSSVEADLLVLSATMDRHIESVGTIISSVRAEEILEGCRILVGGAAFLRNPEAWASAGADMFARDISEAVRFAGNLLNKERDITT